MGQEKKLLGNWAEDTASLFLQREGFRIRERNFFCKVGEIDVIAEKAGALYFIEIRSANTLSLHTSQLVGKAKLRRMQKLVLFWQMLNNSYNSLVNLSVIAIQKQANKQNAYTLNFFEHV